MRKIIKIGLITLLALLIYMLVIIPKLLSFIWYNKWHLDYDSIGIHNAIAELIFSIIEYED